MSTTATPYGLKPYTLDGGSPLGLLQEITLTTNTATAFYEGDLVNMGAGVLTPIGTTPTTTRNGNTPWGVFVGVNYYNSQGQYINANTFPANGYTANSAYGPITMLVVTNPDLQFKIQASAAVAVTDIGKNAAVANFGGNAFGVSTVHLLASSINTTNTLGFKIVAIAPGPGNVAGDTYTDVIVIYNQNVHAFRNILGV